MKRTLTALSNLVERWLTIGFWILVAYIALVIIAHVADTILGWAA